MSKISAGHGFRPSVDTTVGLNRENKNATSRNTSVCSEDPQRMSTNSVISGIAVLRDFQVREEPNDEEMGIAQPNEKW
jgi:hypothetical protein